LRVCMYVSRAFKDRQQLMMETSHISLAL